MEKEPKISETIFNGKSVVIPMMDVQHIEKHYHSSDLVDGTKKGDLSGIMVITKHTTWNFEHDTWENGIWISTHENQVEEFQKAYYYLRYELDIKPTEK